MEVMGRKGTVEVVKGFNRVLMMGLNDTWQHILDDGFRDSLLNTIVMVLVVALGELILLKYVIAHCIYEATWMHKQILT